MNRMFSSCFPEESIAKIGESQRERYILALVKEEWKGHANVLNNMKGALK